MTAVDINTPHLETFLCVQGRVQDLKKEGAQVARGGGEFLDIFRPIRGLLKEFVAKTGGRAPPPPPPLDPRLVFYP